MTLDGVVARILATPIARERRTIALAGPPASGKSTLAGQLCSALSDAAVVPMDGFHLGNDVLRKRGLLSRKGSPDTFDVNGFTNLVKSLQNPGTLSFPTFDRENDCVVPNGGVISDRCKTVLIEGNYLLLDAPRWSNLQSQWDLSIFIDVSESVLEERLIRRWLDHGLTHGQAIEKARSNDIPNARLVIQYRLAADLLF